MFASIKREISLLPVLVSPPSHSTLAIYLAISTSTISSVLVYEDKKKQAPVYFTSRTLQLAEERYYIIEKLALILVFSAQRLRLYFKSFNIMVRTNYPIKQVLQKLELVERMTTCVVVLSEFGLRYKSRGPMKEQFLANFLTELLPYRESRDWWMPSVDRSSNKKGSRAGVILKGPSNLTMEYAIHSTFQHLTIKSSTRHL